MCWRENRMLRRENEANATSASAEDWRKICNAEQNPCSLSTQHRLDLTSEGKLLSEEEKKVYRSSIGRFLFLAMYLRPDVLNALRQLSK